MDWDNLCEHDDFCKQLLRYLDRKKFEDNFTQNIIDTYALLESEEAYKLFLEMVKILEEK